MITLKSPRDLKHLRQAGQILARALAAVIVQVRPGVSTETLNRIAEGFIRKSGAEPSFLGYGPPALPSFPTTLCTSINHEVVHAPATERILREGDIVGIDIGLKMPVGDKYYYVDMARTLPVGKISEAAARLLEVTQQSLNLGIQAVRPGGVVGDISQAIEASATAAGLGIVKKLVGHGVGFAVHEDPSVPNFVAGRGSSVPLRPGMVIAIEPMLNLGGAEVETLSDGWTVVTADGSLSAHFEDTVAVTLVGFEILTRF